MICHFFYSWISMNWLKYLTDIIALTQWGCFNLWDGFTIRDFRYPPSLYGGSEFNKLEIITAKTP